MNPSLPQLPASTSKDSNDQQRLRHARDRHQGFLVGQYLQPPPMLFTRDGHNAYLGDLYRGCAAFLICGGPSLKSHDLSKLGQRGILTLGVNNAATVARPLLWTCVDDPGNFADAIWRDPGIMKFVPLCHMEKPFRVRDTKGELVESQERVGDMPAVFGYRRNECFKPEQFLYEDTFNWGNHSQLTDEYGNKGSRSVMFVALRLLFYLGVRRIYLLGCDFRMEPGKPNYAFEQDRSKSSIRGNNGTYRILNVRFAHLKPYLDSAGCEVFNCTPGSGLTVFPYKDFDSAIEDASSWISAQIQTAGMYDRKERERKQKTAPSIKTPPSEVLRPQVKTLQPTSPHVGMTYLPSEAPRRIDLSVIVHLEPNTADHWQHTWPTWCKFKPWLKDASLYVFYPPGLDVRRSGLGFLQRHSRVRLMRYAGGEPTSQHGSFWRSVLKASQKVIQTPWALLLDPRAIACEFNICPNTQWFHAASGEPAVLVASPWGYAKPADVFKHLDEWADRLPQLQSYPRLNLPFDGTTDRIQLPTINGWCLFAETKWLRRIAELPVESAPCKNLDQLLFYVATRRGDHIQRVPMKRTGWEFTFGSTSGIADRCRQLLAG